MVEFALIAPIFFLLLFGIIEGGRFMFYYEILNNATRDGARYAIVNGANSLMCPTGPPAPGSIACNPSGSHVGDRVKASAFGVLGSGVTVTSTWSGVPPNNARGETVRVTASFTYRSLVPLLPLPPITVQAESSLVINN